MLPVSEAVSLVLNRGGGAKSRAVKVPDFRSKWLSNSVSMRFDILGSQSRVGKLTDLALLKDHQKMMLVADELAA